MKNIIYLALAILALLSVPLIAMQFTQEVNWSPFDFFFIGTLLFSLGLVYQLVARRSNKQVYRYAVGLAVVAVLLLVWVNAAVGIIGDGPVNLMYVGVLLIGIIGASAADFTPLGMARTLIGMAIAQMSVPVLALMVWGSSISWSPGIPEVFVLNAVFAGMFIGSALLFRRAAVE